MITQIYGVKSVEDALGSIAAGGDYIGVGVRSDGLSLERAKEIFAAIRDKATKVAILDLEQGDEQAVLDLARELQPDILHLTGLLKTSAAFFEKFRAQLPGMKLLQAVNMTGPEAVDFALAHMAYADLLILDTPNPDGHIGAAGITHDWNLDAEIIRRSSIPVIIAGGLGPDNIAAAIEATRPFGVDTLTRTNIDNVRRNGKDLEKVRAFCENAKRVAAKLGL